MDDGRGAGYDPVRLAERRLGRDGVPAAVDGCRRGDARYDSPPLRAQAEDQASSFVPGLCRRFFAAVWVHRGRKMAAAAFVPFGCPHADRRGELFPDPGPADDPPVAAPMDFLVVGKRAVRRVVIRLVHSMKHARIGGSIPPVLFCFFLLKAFDEKIVLCYSFLNAGEREAEAWRGRIWI